MNNHKHVWSWPIAGYLFLGGLGAGMAIIASVAELFFGLGYYFIPCALGSLVVLGIGSFLLIFELGRPFQFWRVFSKQKAVLTFGAWMVIALIFFDILFFSFWFELMPWSESALLRDIIATICLLLGLGVLLYTGIELSSMKARVFWNTPALPVLFAFSGLLTGAAANSLLISVWPYVGELTAESLVHALGVEWGLFLVQTLLSMLIVALAVITLIAVFIYVLMIYTSSTQGARKAAKRWLSGSYAPAFWGGLVVAGLVLPLLIYALNVPAFNLVAAVLIIVGGAFLRFLVVYSDDRRELRGEDLYWKRLPKGDETFLKCDW